MRNGTLGKIPVKTLRILSFLLFPQTIGKVLMRYADILSKSFPAYCTKEKLVGPALRHGEERSGGC